MVDMERHREVATKIERSKPFATPWDWMKMYIVGSQPEKFDADIAMITGDWAVDRSPAAFDIAVGTFRRRLHQERLSVSRYQQLILYGTVAAVETLEIDPQHHRLTVPDRFQSLDPVLWWPAQDYYEPVNQRQIDALLAAQ